MAGPVRSYKEFGTICHVKVSKTYEDDLGFYICVSICRILSICLKSQFFSKDKKCAEVAQSVVL